MRKQSYFMVIALMAMLTTLLLAGCNDDNEFEDEDPAGTVMDFGPRGSIASSEKIFHPAIILGSIPEGYATAFSERFTELGAATDVARVAIVDASQLKANAETVVDVYDRDGVAVVVNPNVNEINAWFNELNISREIAPDGNLPVRSLYAFTKSRAYLLDELDESISVNENLNHFVSWLNNCFIVDSNSALILGSGDSAAISELVDAEQFTHTFSYSPKWGDSDHKVWGKTTNWIWGSGSVTVSYAVWPFYSFTDHSDYYIVKTDVIAHNKDMCPNSSENHKWTNDYAGTYTRMCAYYMTELMFSSSLKTYDSGKKAYSDAKNVMFPSGHSPIPATTNNQTSYSTGVNWSLGVDVTIGGSGKKDNKEESWTNTTTTSRGFNAGVTFSGSVSFSNTSTTTIPDQEVHNNSTSTKAVYNYVTNNLPKYQAGSISISVPPARSINNSDFQNIWMWRVSDIQENSKTEYYIETALDIQYGFCHFMSTGADFHRHTFWMSQCNANNQQGDSSPVIYHQKIPAPNRVPSGLLKITNSEDRGYYLYDVRITNSDGKTINSGQSSYATDEAIMIYLPTGDYNIQMKKGKSISSMKDYGFKDDSGKTKVTITKGGTVQLYSDFHFSDEVK